MKHRILKIVAIVFGTMCACALALVATAIGLGLSNWSSLEYESDAVPSVIKVSLDGKYLAKIYSSNFQPPIWTFRPFRPMGVYIQSLETKKEWLIAVPKDQNVLIGDVVWQNGDNLQVFSDVGLKVTPVELEGRMMKVKILPMFK